MEWAHFQTSLAGEQPPSGLSLPLQALWTAAKGDWESAHDLAQSDEGPHGAWVHAYLHRVEGDLGNAEYWYRRAERPTCQGGLEAEWEAIAGALLAGSYPLP
jgi:hypothetical protein